jgi:hypothetical protein
MVEEGKKIGFEKLNWHRIGRIPERYDFFQHPGTIKPLDAAMPARHPGIPFLVQERYGFTILGGGKFPVDRA